MPPYEQLPTSYPPSRIVTPRWRARPVILAVGTVLTIFVIALMAWSQRDPHSEWTPTSTLTHEPGEIIDPPYLYRDAYPIRTMRMFWERAEMEIADRSLDTCDGKLGRGLVDAYVRTRLEYCTGPTNITCVSVKDDEVSDWWPVPEAPCLSTNLRADGRTFSRVRSDITDAGRGLDVRVGTENFVGKGLGESSECGVQVNERALLIIHRQDQWNPFHVGEDMVTTMLTAMVAVNLQPELAERRVQLAFNDEYGIESNHFVDMWDKMGAWAPRRLSLDPWRDECLHEAIHSVGAGVSLLSAQGISNPTTCASSLTWGAAHYYRHLFRLQPVRSINVLWLSRAKFDAWTMAKGDFSPWRSARHLDNEDEVVERLRRGLRTMRGYEEVDDAGWSDDRPGIRFATIDPSVHSLETQVRYVGHASIVVGSHGGAMGLVLFMPPGRGSVLELQVPEVYVNRHFQTMSVQLGLDYEQIKTERTVDVEGLWEIVHRHVLNRMV